MAEEETEISELEFRENLSGDDLIPVETVTNTFATSLIVLKDWFLNYLVGKTGDETIGGVKTFLNKIHIPTPASNAENSEGANVEYVKSKISEIADKVGMVKGYAGTTPPDGWLFCDGSAISRTTYSDLFAVIGTTYGGGDGSTTFNLPNLWVLGETTPVSVYGNGTTIGLSAGNDSTSGAFPLSMATATIAGAVAQYLISSKKAIGINVAEAGEVYNVGSLAGNAPTGQTRGLGLTKFPQYSGIVGTVDTSLATGTARAIIKY